MSYRILHLDIDGFRGIPQHLAVSFSLLENRSASALLVGDNACGKSSVVDAIEFALQGRVGRAGGLPGDALQSLTLGPDAQSRVCVRLEDGTSTERIIKRDVEGKPSFLGSPHPHFRLAPMVLRRSDIIKFWDTPDIQRQVLFFDYFRIDETPTGQISPPAQINADVDAVIEARAALRVERRKAVADLAERLGVQPNTVPLSPELFHDFVRTRVSGGLTKRARRALEHKGMRVTRDQKAVELVTKIQDLSTRIRSLDANVQRLRGNWTKVQPESKSAVSRAMELLSHDVTAAFLELSRAADYIRDVQVRVGTLSEVSLEFSLLLKNGVNAHPRRVLSEANLDLLSISVYLAVAKFSMERGQGKVLVLDDVFQSVDAPVRLSIMSYILDSYPEYQLIITAHDRLWQEQLHTLFQRRGRPLIEYQFLEWDWAQGPRVVSTVSSLADPLRAAVECGSPRQICSEAGLLLERIAHSLSINLAISVIRKREDRYTLADLWPGIAKVLRKTEIEPQVSVLDEWLHLRNLVGAHYNEWATGLSRDEAIRFGRGVIEFYNSVWCSACTRFVEGVRIGGGPVIQWSCRCQQRRLARRSPHASSRSEAMAYDGPAQQCVTADRSGHGPKTRHD